MYRYILLFMTLSEGAARRSAMNINDTIRIVQYIHIFLCILYILLYNYFMYILCLLCKKLLYIVHFYQI